MGLVSTLALDCPPRCRPHSRYTSFTFLLIFLDVAVLVILVGVLCLTELAKERCENVSEKRKIVMKKVFGIFFLVADPGAPKCL